MSLRLAGFVACYGSVYAPTARRGSVARAVRGSWRSQGRPPASGLARAMRRRTLRSEVPQRSASRATPAPAAASSMIRRLRSSRRAAEQRGTWIFSPPRAAASAARFGKPSSSARRCPTRRVLGWSFGTWTVVPPRAATRRSVAASPNTVHLDDLDGWRAVHAAGGRVPGAQRITAHLALDTAGRAPVATGHHPFVEEFVKEMLAAAVLTLRGEWRCG